MNILISNDPDKDYEFWWYSLKNLIMEYLSKKEQIIISDISKKLNILKEKKDYNGIKTIIYTYIRDNLINSENTFLEKILKSQNGHHIHLLYEKINKWNVLFYDNKYNLNMFKLYIFLKMANKASLKIKKSHYKDIIIIISKININFPEFSLLKKILNIALENQMNLVVEQLKMFDCFHFLFEDWLEYFDTKPFDPIIYPARTLSLFWKDYNVKSSEAL